MSLMLHCGAHAIESAELYTLPLPVSQGPRHACIQHSDLLDMTVEQLGNAGYRVTEQAHALSKAGQRYFGLLSVVKEGDYIAKSDYDTVIGLRNSHDQSFPAAIAMGSRVFVCDNLAFSAEVKLQRKHTTYIMRDLPGVINVAIGRVHEARESMASRYDKYKETELGHKDADSAIVQMHRAGIVGQGTLAKVIKEWYEPSHDEFADPTVWRLFNAVTEAGKGQLGSIVRTTSALHGFMDGVCERLH